MMAAVSARDLVDMTPGLGTSLGWPWRARLRRAHRSDHCFSVVAVAFEGSALFLAVSR
ncbi:MAG TPA: hypothetical protein VED63_07595 [Acidimicrobiales bacterium]|nr:hypothetical protein [Acidimicrobiales bacterium]